MNNNCVYFWREDEAYGFLSNFYMAPMFYGGRNFSSSEQLYMWTKARFFEDFVTAERIERAQTPKDAKILGRQVANFNEEEWEEVRFEAMQDALLCKFITNPRLKHLLLDTENKLLIEASPKDVIWGIGMKEKDAISNFGKWEGLNLLGQALMKVRDRLK